MKRNQNGFAHILLIGILVIAVGIVGFIAFQRLNSNNENELKKQYDGQGLPPGGVGNNIIHDKPLLYRLPFDVSDDDTNPAELYGSLDCSKSPYDTKPTNCARSYGRIDMGKQMYDMTFITKKDTKIYSAMDGVVISSNYQADSKDWDVHIANAKSYEPFKYTYEYSVEYDHIADPKVKVGDVVTGNTVIGTAPCGSYDNIDPNKCHYYRFELQLNQATKNERNEIKVNLFCGYDFFNDETKTLLDKILAKSDEIFPESAYGKWCM